jgi:hypothetical protein
VRSSPKANAWIPAAGTLLALAYCEERGGRLATAWRNYQQAAELAASAADAERRAAAEERAAALQPRLSTLTVEVPRALPDSAEISVARDGAEIDRKFWGTPVPVDGGSYVLEASKAGRRVWSFTVTVRSEDDHQTVTISDVRVEEPTTTPPTVAVSVPVRPEPAPAVLSPQRPDSDGAKPSIKWAGAWPSRALRASASERRWHSWRTRRTAARTRTVTATNAAVMRGD